MCLSVAGTTDDGTLERVWGQVPHARVSESVEFVRHVLPLFRAALRAAATAPRSRISA